MSIDFVAAVVSTSKSRTNAVQEQGLTAALTDSETMQHSSRKINKFLIAIARVWKEGEAWESSRRGEEARRVVGRGESRPPNDALLCTDVHAGKMRLACRGEGE